MLLPIYFFELLHYNREYRMNVAVVNGMVYVIVQKRNIQNISRLVRMSTRFGLDGSYFQVLREFS